MAISPSGNGSGSVQEHAAHDADRLIEKAKSDAGELADSAKQAGRQQAEKRFEDGKQVAGEQIDAVQQAVGDAAQRLREEDSPFASYAGELSTQLSSLSSRIESSSVDELVRDGRRVARDNPGLFMLGAVAVGFAAARFLKASEQHDEQDYVSGPDQQAYEDGYRSARTSGRARFQDYRSTRPYRRNVMQTAARSPMHSSETSSHGESTSSVVTPRVNRPVNDLDTSTTPTGGAGA